MDRRECQLFFTKEMLHAFCKWTKIKKGIFDITMIYGSQPLHNERALDTFSDLIYDKKFGTD